MCHDSADCPHRWCFYINLPCDGVAFLILIFFLRIETPKTPLLEGLKAIDWLGLMLIVGGTVMFLFGLEYGGVTDPWNSAIVICLLVFGVVAWALFALVEWKVAKYPLVPLRMFSFRNVPVAFGVAFCHGLVFTAGSFFLPLYFQDVQGASPLLSGVYMFPFIIALSVTSIVSGLYIRKTGSCLEPIWAGLFLMAVGFGLFIALPVDLNWGRIVPFLLIAGLGTGPIFQAPLIALQSSIEPKDMASGTAAFAFMRQVASSISLVIGGVIFQNEMLNRYDTLSAVLSPQDTAAIAEGGVGASLGLIKQLPAHAQAVVHQALTDSLQIMWIFFTVMAVLGLAISLLLQKKVLSRTHQVRQQGLAQQEKERLEQLAKDEEKKRLKRESKRGSKLTDLERGKVAEKDLDVDVPVAGVQKAADTAV